MSFSGGEIFPRDTGSALSLGSAGTRRTVYLSEDEPTPATQPTTSNTNQNNPPMLVYNRISTVIGESSPRRDSAPAVATPFSDESSRENAANDRKKGDNTKENAIWYEYGCV